MSYQWFDSFQGYGTGSASRTAMRDGQVYARLFSEVAADPDPNLTGLCLLIDLDGSSNFDENDNRIALPLPLAGKVGVHGRVWLNSFPSGGSSRPNMVMWRNVANDALCEMRVESNGALTFYNGAGTQVSTTTVPVLTTRAWNHVEVWYDSSDGTGELWVNGVKKLDVTGGTTGTTALICHSRRSGANGGVAWYLKDYGIWDENGTENNTVQGTVIVSRRNPDTDVTLGGWVPSTGTEGYPLLAKNSVNDTTYLSGDNAPPAPMEYTFTPIDPDATSIRAIMSKVRMRKTDGGDATVQASLSPNGTDWDDGADHPITSAFAYWWDISEVSPDTTDPWTPVEFEAVIGRINRTV